MILEHSTIDIEKQDVKIPPGHQEPWKNTVSFQQAFVDLLKSSWILEDVILVRHRQGDPVTVKVRKGVLDLSMVSDFTISNNFQL